MTAAAVRAARRWIFFGFIVGAVKAFALKLHSKGGGEDSLRRAFLTVGTGCRGRIGYFMRALKDHIAVGTSIFI